MDPNYQLSKTFLYDESDEGYGFTCAEYKNSIYAHFWTPDTDSRKVLYYSPASMYRQAKEFSQSELKNYSPLHTAQHLMFKAYMAWCESQEG